MAFEHLVKAVEDGGLDHYDVPGLLKFITDFERVQNLAELVHQRVVADCDRRQVADQLNARNTRTLLAGLLRISEREAGRRVRAATAVGDRVNLQGALIGATRPALAAAQRAGEVNPEQVAIIERALDQVDRPGYDPAEIAAAEQTLTGYAADFGPRDLRRIAAKLVEVLDPDGTLPAEELAQDRRHLYLTANRDGTYTLTGRLTGCVGAALQAVLSPLAKPHIPVDDDGTPVTGNGPRDPRTGGQRLHDALDDACARLLRAVGYRLRVAHRPPSS